jgi:hypothetical protein
MDSDFIARWLIVAGLLIAALGLAVLLVARLPFIGRLPGDISIRGDNFWIFVPLATSIILSVILTVAINVIPRLK